MNYISNSTEATEKIGEVFARSLKEGDVVAMYGALGAGKTAFVRGMAKYLCPKVNITSPTFTVMIEYKDSVRLCHFDMYKITTFEDLYSTGYFDCIESDAICVIEWSENISFALPDTYIRVEIKVLDGEKREIITEEIK